MALREQPITEHCKAWPLETRRHDMRRFVASAAARGELGKLRPAKVAATFGGGRILPCEVEAEMLKYQQEGGDK